MSDESNIYAKYLRLLFMHDRNEHTSLNIYSISRRVKSPKSVPIASVTIILHSNYMALRLISDVPQASGGLRSIYTIGYDMSHSILTLAYGNER